MSMYLKYEDTRRKRAQKLLPFGEFLKALIFSRRTGRHSAAEKNFSLFCVSGKMVGARAPNHQRSAGPARS